MSFLRLHLRTQYPLDTDPRPPPAAGDAGGRGGVGAQPPASPHGV